jgi:hypothetical protein
MGSTTGRCGSRQITYDESCSWYCMCSPSGCTWNVVCPAPGGTTTTTSGTGKVSGGHGRPHFGYDGTAEVIGAALERISGKRVVVPEELRQTRVTGEVDGDVMAVAEKLGFTVMERSTPTA